MVEAKERKELKSLRKTENVLESVDEEGGRYMLNTDSLERESWRVMEDDSKDEKSGREPCPVVKRLSDTFSVRQNMAAFDSSTHLLTLLEAQKLH